MEMKKIFYLVLFVFLGKASIGQDVVNIESLITKGENLTFIVDSTYSEINEEIEVPQDSSYILINSKEFIIKDGRLLNKEAPTKTYSLGSKLVELGKEEGLIVYFAYLSYNNSAPNRNLKIFQSTEKNQFEIVVESDAYNSYFYCRMY